MHDTYTLDDTKHPHKVFESIKNNNDDFLDGWGG